MRLPCHLGIIIQDDYYLHRRCLGIVETCAIAPLHINASMRRTVFRISSAAFLTDESISNYFFQINYNKVVPLHIVQSIV